MQPHFDFDRNETIVLWTSVITLLVLTSFLVTISHIFSSIARFIAEDDDEARSSLPAHAAPIAGGGGGGGYEPHAAHAPAGTSTNPQIMQAARRYQGASETATQLLVPLLTAAALLSVPVPCGKDCIRNSVRTVTCILAWTYVVLAVPYAIAEVVGHHCGMGSKGFFVVLGGVMLTTMTAIPVIMSLLGIWGWYY